MQVERSCVESLLEMDSDLVFQWSEPAKLLIQIEAAGLQVVGLRNNPPDQSSNAKNIQIIGEAIGKSKRAKEITEKQERILKQIKLLLSDGFPKIVIRTDIESFYESIPQK